MKKNIIFSVFLLSLIMLIVIEGCKNNERQTVFTTEEIEEVSSKEEETETELSTEEESTILLFTEEEREILSSFEGTVLNLYSGEILGTAKDVIITTSHVHYVYQSKICDYETKGPLTYLVEIPEQYQDIKCYLGFSDNTASCCLVLQHPDYCCLHITSTRELEEDRMNDAENNYMVILGDQVTDLGERWKSIKTFLSGEW